MLIFQVAHHKKIMEQKEEQPQEDNIFSKLFPGLQVKKPWKHVNLNEVFTKSTESLNMRDVYDQNRLLSQASEADKYYTYGGFGEDRVELWSGFERSVEKMVHLGVDFNNLPEYEPVCALAGGKVIHVMLDESPFNGWGGRVMIQDDTYVYLYGHLFPDAAYLVEEDDDIAEGDIVGYVGPPEMNGGWFPHLHLQIMTHAYVKRFEKDLALLDGYDFQGHLEGIVDPLQWKPK